MTEVALRIELVRLTDLDAQLCSLPAVRLVRADDGLYADCADRASAVRAFARAGARAVPASAYEIPRTCVPAIARHLEPFRGAGVVDVITLRPLSPGEASAWLRARGAFRRHVDPDPIGRLLRGTELAFAWRRVVWAPARAIRSRSLRGLRPIVFDRSAVVRSPETLAFAAASALTRWAA